MLPADNWLVEASFTMRNNGNPAIIGATCGLVQDDTTVLDAVNVAGLAVRGAIESTEVVTVAKVLTDVPADSRVALRWDAGFDEHLDSTTSRSRRSRWAPSAGSDLHPQPRAGMLRVSVSPGG